ncbi:AAA family ATPase [Rubrimonas cliftonensis]|uniref:DNA repair exonuclease SbcCD ATPase subunit n=1 Tax=Rubrimonas cliftonensis TaxID=89524 RepID=A0A1H4CHU7_9RHOB|nr:AAA family ATPase [Rubrimonas cliftonensis]SEA59900.1 DNA repair exonuclease SbcCD ATPase subunit [Rubrimonas cliftonensis]
MRLRALRLHNVRRFEGRGVALEGVADGVNVLAAPNEAGKSTCFDALQALFLERCTGTGKALKSLQPWSGESVTVEADVETAGGLFRVRKQFLSRKRALVSDLAGGGIVAQGDDAEAWIAEMLGGPGAPAGLLWVRQGAVELGGRGEPAPAHEARRDALAAVAGEVEALTGGRRMDRARRRCAEALGALLTDGRRPKKGGPLSDALAEAARLAEREAELAAQVESLRADLARRREARRRLAEISEPQAAQARTAALTEARAALRTAQDHAARAAAAGQAAQLAALTAAQTARALADWREALAEAARRADALDGAFRAMGEADAAAEAAGRDEAAASQALATAEAAARAAADALAAARAATAARAAADALAAREETLARAETARAEAAAASAEAAALAPPEGVVARVAKADDALRALRTAAEGAAPRVVVEPVPGAEDAFTVSGRAVAPGRALSVATPLRIEIAGRGVVTVSPGAGPPDGGAKLAGAEAALARALAEAGAPDRAALESRAAAARDCAARADVATATLSALAPRGLDALRAELAALRRAGAGAAEADEQAPPDPDAAERAARAAEATLAAARQRQSDARGRLAGTASAQAVAASRLEDARRAAEAADRRLGPSEARTPRETALAAESAAAVEADAEARATLERLRAAAPDLAAAEAAERRAVSAAANADAEIARLGVEIARLDGAVETVAGAAPEAALAETQGRRAAAEARAAALQAEADALSRLARALDDARAGASAHYFEPVLAELRPLLAMLMDSAEIAFDEAALLPSEMTRAGRAEPVESLSGGTREQLAVLTRLAFARLIAKGGGAAPVILDDALAFSDDDRIERMFDALHRQAGDLQIVVLTCRQRAFERLGGTVLRFEDWSGE